MSISLRRGEPRRFIVFLCQVLIAVPLVLSPQMVASAGSTVCREDISARASLSMGGHEPDSLSVTLAPVPQAPRGEEPGRPEVVHETQRPRDCIGEYGVFDSSGDCDGVPLDPCC